MTDADAADSEGAWFYCWGCELEFHDPYPNQRGRELRSACEECGAEATRPIESEEDSR